MWNEQIVMCFHDKLVVVTLIANYASMRYNDDELYDERQAK